MDLGDDTGKISPSHWIFFRTSEFNWASTGCSLETAVNWGSVSIHFPPSQCGLPICNSYMVKIHDFHGLSMFKQGHKVLKTLHKKLVKTKSTYEFSWLLRASDDVLIW